ncbi:serine/threonine-protein kinase [Streptomyces sp. 2P-4]|uniref:serine/threonine-protein kinase n=1 Tax=Streptomyces sp. 2P-4 TaxID=2931974 RepID=UPI0025405358|nr:serine/threonine-protein kinase [Streptomyces sp. 2P-4]
MSKPEHTDSPAAEQGRAKPVSGEPEPSVKAVPPARTPAAEAGPGAAEPKAAGAAAAGPQDTGQSGSASPKPDLGKPKAAPAAAPAPEDGGAAGSASPKPKAAGAAAARAAANPPGGTPADAASAAAGRPEPATRKPSLAKPRPATATGSASAHPKTAKPANPKAGAAPAASASAAPQNPQPRPVQSSAAASDSASADLKDAKPAAPLAGAAANSSAAVASEDAKPSLAKGAAAGGGSASERSEGAKPGPSQGAAAAPDSASAGAASAKPDLAKGGAAATASGSAEPEDAKPGLAKDAAAAAGSASTRGEEAKPKAGAQADAVRTTSGNPIIDKADAVAAAVKAAAVKAADDSGREGRLLAGRYRLGEVLGKGGMGTVWRAEDETLGRTVAVKELRFGNGVDEDEKRRLITRTLREAKAIARIRSGGAVTVFDVVDEDGRPWIVMELIEGPSLAEFIREQGPLTPRRAAEVGLAVLEVLRAAHGQGILHRDVKPSNVLIAANGRVVLTDFGIAQVEGDPSITSTGMLVGAPSYISPERARGQKPGPPADMWSLGGLLYAAVEGVPPYDKGSALATLTAVMTEPVEPPKNAGPLTEVIYGLLVKDPARRLDEERARVMLTAVVNMPEPEAVEVLAPAVEETRQISLTAAKEAAAKAAADKAAEKAEKKERERREKEQRERARAALKAARKAAAATAATAAAATAAEPPASGGARTGPVAAPLTDVMSRRTIGLAIVGVVVALAAIGSLIVYAFSGGDSEEQGKGAPGPTASGKPSPGPSGKTGDAGSTGGGAGGSSPSAQGQTPSGQESPGQAQGQGQGQGQASAQGQGQGSDPGGPAAGLPAGFATVTDLGFRFSMAMPQDFRHTDTAGDNSGAIYSRDGGFPRIQVDFTSRPGEDARAAWAALAPAVARSSKGYRTIRIDAVGYRDYPTVADWEFEREQQGIKVRVLDRGFKVDAARGYAIMISCAADQWDGPECRQLRDTAFATFQPLG